jgi:hypothetical protein
VHCHMLRAAIVTHMLREMLLTTSVPLQALLEMKQLLTQQCAKSSEGGVMKRMLQFLSAQGFRQQFELQEQELRDCLVQLSTILSMAQITSQVGAATAAEARTDSSPCVNVRSLV